MKIMYWSEIICWWSNFRFSVINKWPTFNLNYRTSLKPVEYFNIFEQSTRKCPALRKTSTFIVWIKYYFNLMNYNIRIYIHNNSKIYKYYFIHYCYLYIIYGLTVFFPLVIFSGSFYLEFWVLGTLSSTFYIHYP